MNQHGGVKEQLHAFLISGLKCGWLASRYSRFDPEEVISSYLPDMRLCESQFCVEAITVGKNPSWSRWHSEHPAHILVIKSTECLRTWEISPF
jgi:hypothetical protein